MVVSYNKEPVEVIRARNRSISIFDTAGENIDAQVVNAFGEEWLKFQRYSDEDIRSLAIMYFDIL